MSRTSDFLRTETQDDGASAISNIKKVCRNILAVTVMSTMVVATFPAGAVFADEGDEVIACAEDRVADTDAGEELRADGIYDADGEMICSIAVEGGEDEPEAPVLGSYNPDDLRKVLVSDENSSAQWDSEDGTRTKVTSKYNEDHMAKVVKDNELVDAIIKCDDHSDKYSFEMFVDGESVATIDYSNGNDIVVNVTDDIGFVVRWQSNDGYYIYYTIKGAGNYVIPNTSNITDMWIGPGEIVEKPEPRTFTCEEVVPSKRDLFRSGEVVTFTIVTDADDMDDVEIYYAANNEIVGKTFGYTIDELKSSDVRVIDGKNIFTVEVVVSFRDNGRDGQITYVDCGAEIELEAASGEVFCELPGLVGLRIPLNDERCSIPEIPQTGVFYGATAAANAVEYAAYNNDLMMMGAAAAGSVIAAGASKKSRKEDK